LSHECDRPHVLGLVVAAEHNLVEVSVGPRLEVTSRATDGMPP
jgi:hypothetical protein